MKQTLLIFLTTIPIFGFGQTESTLSDILWDRVNDCYSMFEDMDEDGVPDFDKIDDSKNGYLKISGSWPTCGCSCSSTVGAYKNSDGEYILLQSDHALCSWERKVSSNKVLKDILPVDFGMNSFMSERTDVKSDNPIFFIDFDIPHIGTDTKVKIELIPFGLFPEGDQAICFEYKQDNPHKSLYGIREIAVKMIHENTLTHLLNGEFSKISENDNELILQEIGTDDSRFKSKSEIQKYLIGLKKAYDIYSKLESDELILGWNRAESRFFIKQKGEQMNNVSFRDFFNQKYILELDVLRTNLS